MCEVPRPFYTMRFAVLHYMIASTERPFVEVPVMCALELLNGLQGPLG